MVRFPPFLGSYGILTQILYRWLQELFRSCSNYFLAIVEVCEYLHCLFQFDCRYQLIFSLLGNLIPLVIFACLIANVSGVWDCFHWKERLVTCISSMQSSFLVENACRDLQQWTRSHCLCSQSRVPSQVILPLFGGFILFCSSCCFLPTTGCFCHLCKHM